MVVSCRGIVRGVLLPAVSLVGALLWAGSGEDPRSRERGPVFSVSAAPRLGVMTAGGVDVIGRIGFGAGLDFRVHALRLGPTRWGGVIHAGHTRYLDRRSFTDDRGGIVRLYAALGHSDFSAGPSVLILLGPVFFELDVAVGVGISTLRRPVAAEPGAVEVYDDVTFMLRGGGDFAVPVRGPHSIMVGAAVHRYFSTLQVAAAPPTEPYGGEPDTNPFDLMVDIHLGYHFMF